MLYDQKACRCIDLGYTATLSKFEGVFIDISVGLTLLGQNAFNSLPIPQSKLLTTMMMMMMMMMTPTYRQFKCYFSLLSLRLKDFK